VHRPGVTELHLVLSHVGQPLVEGWAHEHQGLHPFTILSIQNALTTPP
jgi:hypothetical protein